MASTDIFFPNHTGLLGSGSVPNIDGFVEPDIGVVTSEPIDSGWTRNYRLTYGEATYLNLMTFQGLKHTTQNFLYMSFMVRFDSNFDSEDVIVLVFRETNPTAAERTNDTKNGTERRIDIFPCFEGLGGGPVGSADDTPAVPSGMPMSSTYKIRTNRIPNNVEYYRWNTTTDSWESMAAISNIEIKVRTWDEGSNNKNWSVELKIPTVNTAAGGGANWINLATEFGFYFNVIRVCGSALCAETSIDVPTQTFDSVQFTFPRADYAAVNLVNDPRTNPDDSRLLHDSNTIDVPLIQHPIPLRWLAKATLGSTTGAEGVKFVNEGLSIGVRETGSGGNLGSNIDALATAVNTFVARVKNTNPTTAMNGVKAEFRLRNLGIAPTVASVWDLIPGRAISGPITAANNQNPTIGSDVPDSTPVDIELKWQLNNAERTAYAAQTAQCMWVQLTAGGNVDIIESSVTRNMYFINTSVFDGQAEISGQGLAKPVSSNQHDYLLKVSKRQIVSRQVRNQNLRIADGEKARVDDRPFTETEQLWRQFDQLLRQILQQATETSTELNHWIWIMNGYRRTGLRVTIGNKVFGIYEPVNGFGYVAEHKGAIQGWRDTIVGDGLKQASTDSYRLTVPDGGSVMIRTRIESLEEGNVNVLVEGCRKMIMDFINSLFGRRQ